MATKTKPKTKPTKWKTIKDDKVIHIWECLACGEKAEVNPTFYEEAGTPMCENCDDDMTYVKTQIRL